MRGWRGGWQARTRAGVTACGEQTDALLAVAISLCLCFLPTSIRSLCVPLCVSLFCLLLFLLFFAS